ncbi:CobW family GTP-binding protein [Nocardioides caeni]|uniref:GTP-binding protein n=1 Tax=Nocardioides caeni TaxID=574700 RepID=A0A4S8NCI8_9ACTN|nr:CobW family GTP-binding protein [Nocardioides caeni]THV12869.1 GTP-binding protein [Nocardioides caeni]
MQPRVPVIALTGHLGAGKTTLLNHLLGQPGARVGVVVNDFGDINVDAALVSGQVDEPASIAGGCLCCLEDGEGLDEALEKLADPRRGLDAIVVEASGIAEPGALARMIRFSGAANVRPGGVVDVVDAVEYFATVDGGGLPPARFAIASLVVLNKCDRLPEDEREDTLARIEERIREANPHVTIVRTSRGQIDPALVHDVASAEEPEDELPIAALLRAERPAHRHHAHAASATVTVAGPIEPGALVDLLEAPPEGAYRMKGTVVVDAGRRQQGYVVHVVGRQVHVTPCAPPGTSTLVAIGLDLDPATVRPALQTGLRAAERTDPAGLRRLRRLRLLSE